MYYSSTFLTSSTGSDTYVMYSSFTCSSPGDVHLSKYLDMLDELSETEFEEYFHEEPITDKKEFRARVEALKEEEEQIKEVNAEYLRGNSSYYEGLNKYSDLTPDEFRAQRTGLGPTNQYGRGLILPPPWGAL